MSITFDLSALSRTKPREYAIRFLLGGAITVATGLVAKYFGPVIGGLFLAFPAIFPASATLIEKHEKQKKLRAGIARTKRGRQAAALDARGAALGSLGLICFALAVWKGLPAWNAAVVLVGAVGVWLAVALLSWRIHKRVRHH